MSNRSKDNNDMSNGSKNGFFSRILVGGLGGALGTGIVALVVTQCFPPPRQEIWSVTQKSPQVDSYATFYLKVSKNGKIKEGSTSEWNRGSGGVVNTITGSIKNDSVDLTRILSDGAAGRYQMFTGDISFDDKNTNLKIIEGKWTGYPLANPNESYDWTATILAE